MMQKFMSVINREIKLSKLGNGKSLYNIHSQFSIAMDDESSFHNLILSCNASLAECTEDESIYEKQESFFQSLNKSLSLKFPEFTYSSSPISGDFLSNSNDFMRTQQTDHNIIITILESGQY